MSHLDGISKPPNTENQYFNHVIVLRSYIKLLLLLVIEVFFYKYSSIVNTMSISIEEFIEKYYIDNFNEILELKGQKKVNFYNDFIDLIKSIARIFDKLTNIASLRGGQVLMSLAKLEKSESVINKTDIKRNLNIDRLEKLVHAFEYLEQNNYINIEKKTSKFHVIKLNEKDNPDFTLFREIVQKFWISPEEEEERVKKWRGMK